jgi:CheY-like chemotaxis protein
MHVLIVEDDLDLGRALQQSLAAEGLSSEWVRRAAEASRFILRSGVYDCVLLDLSLADGDGLDLLRRWRRVGLSVPVIIITAQSALDLRLAGLHDGADDFVLKPFVIAELIARVRAVVRRYARQASDVWRIGPLEIQPRACTASVDGSRSPPVAWDAWYAVHVRRGALGILIPARVQPGAGKWKLDGDRLCINVDADPWNCGDFHRISDIRYYFSLRGYNQDYNPLDLK